MVLHNCAARAVHLPALLESGATVFHFGAPMDLASALEKVDGATVVCGNLDPVGVFIQCSPEAVRSKTLALLETTKGRRNHLVSSGCDVPASVPMGQLDAFFEVVHEWQAR